MGIRAKLLQLLSPSLYKICLCNQNQQSMRAYIIFLSICLGVLTIPDGFFSRDSIIDTTTAASIDIPVIDMAIVKQTPKSDTILAPTIPKEKKLPPSVYIYTPYYTQAPDGDRKLPWSMLCSEANLVLAAYAVKGKTLSKEQFKKEMLAMIPLQEKAFGTYFSIPMHDLKSVYDTIYPDIGKTWILDNPSIDDIKSQLAQGHLVIAPTAGKLLGNPFFINGWPTFHTILIIWYDDTYFYTNEVGMSNGENYRYTHDTVMYAMHDFVRNGNVTQWAKLVMVIEK